MLNIVSSNEPRSLKRKRGAAVSLSPLRVSSTPLLHGPHTYKDPALNIRDLERLILKSRQYYNNISTLLACMTSSEVSQFRIHEAVLALCRIFSRLMARGGMTAPQHLDKNESMVVEWLRRKYEEYCDNLLDSLANGTSEEKRTSLTVLMQLFREEYSGQNSNEELTWNKGIFPSIVQVVINLITRDRIQETFIEEYVEQCADIRFYTFQTLTRFASTKNITASLDGVISMLIAVNASDGAEERIEPLYIDPPKRRSKTYSRAAQRRVAQDAWMVVLRRSLTVVQRKSLLRAMPHRIAPAFLKPEILMDFLIDSFETAGPVSLLALAGLFHLMQVKNLDYPQFYLKLYSLLDFQVLHSKHRSRFFRLLEGFLASTHLPTILVASFVKRLSRLCLGAPPPAIVVVVPWIYNLLKNHPTCTFMIQRDNHQAERKVRFPAAEFHDSFRMDENDPMFTQAIESSLWEIETLQSHYHPNVAAISRIVSEQFTKQGYNVEDFLDHTYGSMLGTELEQAMTKAPVIEYEIPKHILVANSEETPDLQSSVAQLWDLEATMDE
ncbi:hypothetical protein MMC26_007675 [Xylographa opegraphella]|nr:hypothetical protein [Xylographa opegraphella]